LPGIISISIEFLPPVVPFGAEYDNVDVEDIEDEEGILVV